MYRWTLTHISNVSSAIVLEKDPIGWDDCILKLSRDPFYHGVFIDYSLLLKFHCDGGGKQFIDGVYQSDDINGNIEVLIEYACDGGTYEELYTGKLNLASYTTDGEFTTCNIEKSNLWAKLKAREEVKVDLETTTSIGGETITAVTPTTLGLESLLIKMEGSSNLTEYQKFTTPDFDFDVGITVQGFFSQQFSIQKQELDLTFPWVTLERLEENLTTATVDIQEIFQAVSNEYGYPLTINFNAYLNAVVTPNPTPPSMAYTGTLGLTLAYGFDLNSATKISLWNTSFDETDLDIPTGAINLFQSIQVNKGERIWFYWAISNLLPTSGGGGTETINFDFEYYGYSGDYFAEVNLTAFTNYPETTCKTLLVHEAYNQVIDAIGDSDNNFYSDFYGRTDSEKITYGSDGCGSQLAITNGLCIREFDKPVFCSLKDLFNSTNTLHNIGLTIDNDKIRVEEMSFFYDNTTESISLSRGVKVERVNDNTRYFNNIQIGYMKWETSYRGGLDEPCSKHEYSTIINAVKSQYNKICDYVSSMYAIELTRRHNIDFFPTEDYTYDEDNFFIATYRAGYGIVAERYEDSFSNISGLLAATISPTVIYNLRLTPSRMLLAHLNVITAGLQTIQGDIKFIKGEGNTTLAVNQDDIGCPENYSGENLAESQSFTWNDSNAMNITPLWQPEIYRFEYPITYAEFKTIRANPHGYISVTDDHNNVLKGFILNMEYKMKSGLTTFELLKMFEA